MSAPQVVVLGMMGRTPFAGVAWQVLHYVEGLRRLGCAVTYVEDTGDWPYDAEKNTITDDPAYTVGYIGRCLAHIPEAVPWAYVGPTREVFGATGLPEVWRNADALVNLTGATVLQEEHMQVPVRAYVETDPVLPQIEVAEGREFTIDLLAAHTHHFTYGELIGTPGCEVPIGRFDYIPTRQPVVLDWWAHVPGRPTRPFTTVASWRQSGKDVEWRGDTYTWSKHHEFMKVLDLPRRSGAEFELALSIDHPEDERLLTRHGWTLVDGGALSREIDPYRGYVRTSRGEFTVAKDQNVRLRSGWFSDRSACYLAAGRPVVTQDTGFGEVLPTGRGLFAFRTLDEAADAIAAIESGYEEHSRAAAAIAAEHFAAEAVLARLLAACGLEPARAS